MLQDFETHTGKESFDPYDVKYHHKHLVDTANQSKPFTRRVVLPELFFVTMTEYERDLPCIVAFPLVPVTMPIGKVFSLAGVRQLHVSETEKERFIGYYFNGMREDPFTGEDRVIVPSPKVATYDLQPEMSAYELTKQIINRLTTDKQDELIAGALGKAIRHAQRVCVREHIKADRVERVNLFLTSLRREVSYLESHQHNISIDLRQWLQAMLCEKAYWHDIGITTASGHNLFGNWLQMAKRQSHSADAQSEMILADLEELERGLVAVQSTVHDAERINKEGDEYV